MSMSGLLCRTWLDVMGGRALGDLTYEEPELQP